MPKKEKGKNVGRKSKRTETLSAPKQSLLCFGCGKDLSEPQKIEYGEFPGWRKGPVVHCKGSAISFGSRFRDRDHHGHFKYRCRKCNGDLGCDICAQPVMEIVCTHCHDWGLFEGEQEHGKMLPNPKFTQKKVEAIIGETISLLTFIDKSQPVEERRVLLQEQAQILKTKE